MIKQGLIALMTVALLSGCADQYGRGGLDEQQIGTVLGAVGGAAVGSQFGRGKGRVVGGAIGAAGGAVLGSEIGKSMKQRRQPQQPRSYYDPDNQYYDNGADNGYVYGNSRGPRKRVVYVYEDPNSGQMMY